MAAQTSATSQAVAFLLIIIAMSILYRTRLQNGKETAESKQDTKVRVKEVIEEIVLDTACTPTDNNGCRGNSAATVIAFDADAQEFTATTTTGTPSPYWGKNQGLGYEAVRCVPKSTISLENLDNVWKGLTLMFYNTNGYVNTGGGIHDLAERTGSLSLTPLPIKIVSLLAEVKKIFVPGLSSYDNANIFCSAIVNGLKLRAAAVAPFNQTEIMVADILQNTFEDLPEKNSSFGPIVVSTPRNVSDTICKDVSEVNPCCLPIANNQTKWRSSVGMMGRLLQRLCSPFYNNNANGVQVPCPYSETCYPYKNVSFIEAQCQCIPTNIDKLQNWKLWSGTGANCSSLLTGNFPAVSEYGENIDIYYLAAFYATQHLRKYLDLYNGALVANFRTSQVPCGPTWDLAAPYSSADTLKEYNTPWRRHFRRVTDCSGSNCVISFTTYSNEQPVLPHIPKVDPTRRYGNQVNVTYFWPGGRF